MIVFTIFAFRIENNTTKLKIMGKGDIKTKKGKLARGSYGKTRQRKKATVISAPAKPKAKKAAAPAKKEAAAKTSNEKLSAADLKKMTVKDLKALADKQGIELPAKALKADIVKALS